MIFHHSWFCFWLYLAMIVIGQLIRVASRRDLTSSLAVDATSLPILASSSFWNVYSSRSLLYQIVVGLVWKVITFWCSFSELNHSSRLAPIKSGSQYDRRTFTFSSPCESFEGSNIAHEYRRTYLGLYYHVFSPSISSLISDLYPIL